METHDWYIPASGLAVLAVVVAISQSLSLPVSRWMAAVDMMAMATMLTAFYFLTMAGKTYDGSIVRPIALICLGGPMYGIAFHLSTLVPFVRNLSLHFTPNFWTLFFHAATVFGLLLLLYAFRVFYVLGRGKG